MMSNRVIGGILAAATMFVAADMSRAALSWDTDASHAGADGGSGTWDLNTTKNWNNGSGNVVWTALNDAVFDATGGTVNVSGTNMNPNTITINSTGYKFTGSDLSVKSTAVDALYVRADVEFDNSITSNITIDSGKTLTLAGSGSLKSVSGGSVSITGGTPSVYSASFNTVVSQTGGVVGASGASANPRIGYSGTGSWTVDNSAAQLNVNGYSGFLDLGRYLSTTALSGTGTLTINSGSVSITNGASIRLGVGGSSAGTLTVAGGTLNVTGAGTDASGTNTTNSVLYITESAAGNSTFSVTGGTANVDAIQFGKTATGTSGQGTLNVSGTGTLNVGAGGISLGKAGNKSTINLSGGTVGAAAGWSSSLGMNLLAPGTGITGIATFRADDGATTPVAHNITLSGKLTGGGALNKTGGGTLTLSGANDYSGETTIRAGTLALGSGGAIASSRISVAQGATFDVNGAGGFSVGSGKTLAGGGTVNGGVTLIGGATLSPGFDVNSAGTLKLGTLTLAGNGTMDLSQYGDLITAANLNHTGGTVNVLAPAGLTSNYTLLTLTSGAPDKSWFQLSGAPSTYSLAVEGHNLVVAVPEPASIATLFGFGAFGLLSGRRRRQA